MILFLLNNWRCLLKISLSVIIIITTLYVVHLYNKVGELEGENKTITDSLNYTNGYIKKYQEAKAENDAMSVQLTSQLENIHDDPKCAVPDSVRAVIAQLH